MEPTRPNARKLQFGLRSAFIVMLFVSWFFAMSRVGGVQHVATTFFLGAISGVLAGSAIGLWSRGADVAYMRRNGARYGALTGTIVGSTLGGLLPGEAYHLVIVMSAAIAYWISSAAKRWRGATRLNPVARVQT